MLQRLKIVYYVLRNLRNAARNAMFGADYVHLKQLQRAGRYTQGPQTYGVPRIFEYDGGKERLHVGSYCSLNGAFILGGQHAVNALTTYPHRINWKLEGRYEDGFPTPKGDTVLGSDVWTCAGSLILSGVRIGDGAIVGAGAVVTKDVPPYAIVGGSPAQVLRYRFDEDVREQLLQIRWWEWPEEEIRRMLPLISGTDADALIAYARTRSDSRPGVVTR